jgi:hypothetical protein
MVTSRQAVHAIRSGTLLHGTGADSVRDAVVLVEDGRIGSGGRGARGAGGLLGVKREGWTVASLGGRRRLGWPRRQAVAACARFRKARLIGLCGLTARRSWASASARPLRPPRTAASVSVQSMTSRWAWLPLNWLAMKRAVCRPSAHWR